MNARRKFMNVRSVDLVYFRYHAKAFYRSSIININMLFLRNYILDQNISCLCMLNIARANIDFALYKLK